MSKWKLKEMCFNSLNELNAYIQENDIAPNSILKYDTLFDQIKQAMRYQITYWTVKE